MAPTKETLTIRVGKKLVGVDGENTITIDLLNGEDDAMVELLEQKEENGKLLEEAHIGQTQLLEGQSRVSLRHQQSGKLKFIARACGHSAAVIVTVAELDISLDKDSIGVGDRSSLRVRLAATGVRQVDGDDEPISVSLTKLEPTQEHVAQFDEKLRGIQGCSIDHLIEESGTFRWTVSWQNHIKTIDVVVVVADKSMFRTLPVLTKYERARLIGTRATQISLGAPVLVQHGAVDPVAIATAELREMVIPLVVRRYLPDGSYEDWPITAFESGVHS